MVGDPPAAAISVLLFRGMIEIPDARSRAESVRLAERYFALFRQGDVAGMLALLHPDVEWVLKSTRPGDVLRGKGEAEAFFDLISGSSMSSPPRCIDRSTTSESSSKDV